MSPQPRNLGLAVAVLTALLTLLGVVMGLLMWVFPGGPDELIGAVLGSLQPPSSVETIDDEDATTGGREKPSAPLGPATKPDDPRLRQTDPTDVRQAPRQPETTDSVRIGSGQQRVLFGGDLILGADFNQIGGQIVPTLHLQAGDGPTQHHALLSVGGSYSAFSSRGEYRVWVLSINSNRQDLEVRAARVDDVDLR